MAVSFFFLILLIRVALVIGPGGTAVVDQHDHIGADGDDIQGFFRAVAQTTLCQVTGGIGNHRGLLVGHKPVRALKDRRLPTGKLQQVPSLVLFTEK